MEHEIITSTIKGWEGEVSTLGFSEGEVSTLLLSLGGGGGGEHTVTLSGRGR